jgi:hypothetical protein
LDCGPAGTVFGFAKHWTVTYLLWFVDALANAYPTSTRELRENNSGKPWSLLAQLELIVGSRYGETAQEEKNTRVEAQGEG